MTALNSKSYPTKTTVNLIVHERSARRSLRLLALVVVLVLLVAVFCKFAVIDRLNAADDAQRAADAQLARLAELQEDNADYEAVRLEYAKYFSADLEAEAPAAADCMDVLSLIERKLMPRAGITSAAFAGSTLTVRLNEIDLSGVSALVDTLYESPLVSSVELYTADAAIAGASDENSTITLTILLVTEGGGEA